MAAAVAAVLVAITLAREVLAEPVEIRVFSSAAPRGVLNEIAPVTKRCGCKPIGPEVLS
jgi:hypothetical protein